MIRYGNPQEVEDYFANEAVSQSYLKTLLKGVDYLGEDEKKMYYEEKGHFIIGSAVDVWLTQGKENFDLQYFVFEGIKPSDTLMSIAQQVFDSACFDDNAPEGDMHQYSSYVLEAIEAHNYQPNWKEDTRINKVMEGCFTYFEQLKLAFGKQILSSIEMQLVYNIVMSLQSGRFTNLYFKDSKDIDIYYQTPIYFEVEGVPCKALIDMLIVNRADKTISPIDIKTIGNNVKEFPHAVKNRGYNIQGSFYTQALLELLIGNATSTIEMKLTSEYVILDFKFLVETTVYKTNAITGETKYNTGKPLCYVLSSAQNMLGKYGRPALTQDVAIVGGIYSFPITYQPIKGFYDAINLYKWHLENGFEYDKEAIESNGVTLLE
jgi:hypothetical protein